MGSSERNLPETSDWVTSTWHDLGRCQQSVAGMLPLCWQDIRAYDSKMEDFIGQLLISMSRDYISEIAMSTDDPCRPAPNFDVSDIEKTRQSVSESLKSMFIRGS